MGWVGGGRPPGDGKRRDWSSCGFALIDGGKKNMSLCETAMAMEEGFLRTKCNFCSR